MNRSRRSVPGLRRIPNARSFTLLMRNSSTHRDVGVDALDRDVLSHADRQSVRCPAIDGSARDDSERQIPRQPLGEDVCRTESNGSDVPPMPFMSLPAPKPANRQQVIRNLPTREALLQCGTEILHRCPLLCNQVHDCERGGIKFCHDPTSDQC